MIRSKKFWGILLSAFFLWLALRKVEWERLPPILTTVDPWFTALFLGNLTLEHLTRAWRWQLILKDRGVPFGSMYCGLLLGFFFNNVLPARAGEFIRAAYLGRKGIIPSSEAFGSIVLERMADGIAVVTLLVASLALFPLSPAIRQAGYSAMIFYLVVLAGILVLQFRKDWIVGMTGFILGFLPERYRERGVSVQESFIKGLDLVRDPARFLLVAAVSLLAWGLSTLSYFLCFKVFHITLGFDAAILLIAVLSLGAMIPSSPGMIGIFEYCCMLILADFFGLSKELAASYGLFVHFLGYLYVLVIGIVILTWENLSMQDLQEPPPVTGP